MENKKEQQYQQMVGEYIGLMASLENALTILLLEYLGVQNYQEEFSSWFLEAPIPFSYKVSLLKKMEQDNAILSTNFPDFWEDLDELHKFRNILAHSFGFLGNMMTSRGKKIPAEHVTYEVLNEKLTRLKKLEDTVKYMYDCEIIGSPEPFSSDDFADWPT